MPRPSLKILACTALAPGAGAAAASAAPPTAALPVEAAAPGTAPHTHGRRPRVPSIVPAA